jgi:hypothetical protein
VLYQFYRLLRGTERLRMLRRQIHLNMEVLLRLLRVSLTGILQFAICPHQLDRTGPHRQHLRIGRARGLYHRHPHRHLHHSSLVGT